MTASSDAARRSACAFPILKGLAGTGASLPGVSKAGSRRRSAPVPLVVTAIFLLLSSFSYADDAMVVRIAWGGGKEKTWEGSIAVDRGTVSQPHLLGIEADEPGSMWLEQGRLMVRQRSPRSYDGVDLLVTAPADAKLIVQLTADSNVSGTLRVPPSSGTRSVPDTIEIPLAELSAEFHTRELDKQENHLLVRRAPGDALLVRTARPSLIFSPGEKFHGEIVPRKLPFPVDGGVQFKMQLLTGQQRSLWTRTVDYSGPPAEPLPLDVTLPESEGVYDLLITAQQKGGWSRPWRNSLQWKRPLIERRVQLIVVAQQGPAGGTSESVSSGRASSEFPTAKGTVPFLPTQKSGQSPELHPIVEIDPTNAGWGEKVKLPQWPRFSRGSSGPLGNGMRETIHHPLGDLAQLKPSAVSPDVSWEAYPLSIGSPGRPHLLEVDYPGNVPQTLGISIIETNAAGVLVPISLDSGIDVSDEAASLAEPHWVHHRLVFWPRTAAPLVLLTNRRQQSPAVYGKIRVLAGGEHLGGWTSGAGATEGDSPVFAGAKTGTVPQMRLLAAYMDRPLLPENFSAEEVLDAWSGRTLHDWRTFQQAGTRLVEYLRYAGYNGLVLTVAADGSAIYPSDVLQPTPRYDTGVFFASGQDPMPKDVLELLLRLTDREELQLIPSIEFATPLPALEAIRRRGGQEAAGLEWVGADGNTWCQTYAPRRGLAPYYNLLDPRVQETMLAAVRELVTRYAGHRSFRGLALRLSAYGYAQLPGPEWGMDDATIARFENETGLKVPGEGTVPIFAGYPRSGSAKMGPSPLPPQGATRFAARAAFLNSAEHRPLWLQWRAAQCQSFYRRVQETLAAARPDMPLYLAGAETFAGPDVEAELRPAPLRQTSLATAMLQVGIDPALYRDDSKIVLLRAQHVAPAAPLSAPAIDLELNQLAETDAFFRGLPRPGSLFFHPPLESRVPTFDQKVAVKSSGTLLFSQIVPSDEENRRRFAESLAAHDAQVLIDGGWMLPLGQEAAMQRFAAGFSRLPPVHFVDAEEGRPGRAVVFRWAAHDGKTYAYAVNTTPFAVAAKVRVAASANCALDDLSGGGAGRLQADADGLIWNVQLQPYDLAVARFSDADARLSQPEAELPNHAVQWIAGRIRELGARAAVLRTPPPLPVLENADFQAKPSEADPVPGWAVSQRKGVSIITDTTHGHLGEDSPQTDSQVHLTNGRTESGVQTAADKGAQSVKIVSDGPVACLVSRPFAPPRSGRLAISVWLKVADAEHQPNLRLAVEGKLAGREYYRFAVLGQPPASGQPASPIDTAWRRFIVPFDNLPLEGMPQMQVRIDLMGAGQVWADDVQLFDLAFNESELRALYKLLTLADLALQNGEAGESLKLLRGYWPQFLQRNVPLPPPAPAVAAQPADPPPADAAPVSAPSSSGWMDRMKGILPERWR